MSREAVVASSQHPGALGSFATDANGLIGAMDIDPAIVISPSLQGDPRQGGVFPTLGTLVPTYGANFGWMSTGIAAAGTPQTADPTATGTQPGTSGLGTCSMGGSYFDCLTLTFSFSVPAGMNSIRFDFNFMSTEYPEWVGTQFNDTFTVSLSSPSFTYSNIVFDMNGNDVTINSAFFNQPCNTLGGTGFDLYSFGSDCDAGATGLLTTEAPVAPGETVTMVFTIADMGDSAWDSAVYLDNFVLSEDMVDGPQTAGQVYIDYLSPKSGPLAGGTSTLIHGDGFENVSAVSFGGVPAVYNVLDEFTIQAITPPHSEGAVDVAVTAQPGNAVSTGVRAGAFIYYVSPPDSPLAVVSVDPPEGPGDGGVAVAVRGSGFKPDTIITFDGEAVASQQFINSDEIVVITPSGSGDADVRAANSTGESAQLDGGYHYLGGGGGGNGARGFGGGGCACSLGSTDAPASTAAAPLAIAGLVIAAWLVRRRGFDVRKAAMAASVPVAFFTAGCNDPQLAPANSGPIADAGPSQEAFVGEAVVLDGTESRDYEDGDNLTFAWEIVTKPEGSTVVLDDPSEKTPSLIADRPGLYRIGLIVTDTDMIESGPIGYGGTDDDNLVDVTVLPFRDLRVTLTWDQAGSDLDLHLIRPNTDWFYFGYFNPDFDCFYGSPDAEWGTVGIEADNPQLALDVDTGMGPETISVASPQDIGTYRVLVHVFNQHDAPPALATVSISVEGTTIAEVVSSSALNGTDTVWQVGTFSWPEQVFTEENWMTTHQWLNGPPH